MQSRWYTLVDSGAACAVSETAWTGCLRCEMGCLCSMRLCALAGISITHDKEAPLCRTRCNIHAGVKAMHVTLAYWTLVKACSALR